MGLTYHLCVSLTHFFGATCFGLQIHGRENMINEGPAILAMNHQSFLDPPLAAACCDREIHFLARKTLFNIPILGGLLKRLNVIGVDRDGNDMAALKSVIRTIRSGGSAIIFPEGTRTSDGALQPAKAGIGLVIAKTLAPVVPIRISGAFDAFPRTSKFPRRSRITMIVGRPLYFTAADFAGEAREAYKSASDRVMAAIAALST